MVEEGGNVEVYCNVTAGIPYPTVLWRNVKTGERIEENPLNINNISRDQAGEYRCTANNTCGEESTVLIIDVQCKNITRLLLSQWRTLMCSYWLNSCCSDEKGH